MLGRQHSESSSEHKEKGPLTWPTDWAVCCKSHSHLKYPSSFAWGRDMDGESHCGLVLVIELSVIE